MTTKIAVIDCSSDAFDREAALNSLRDAGCVVLRGLFAEDDLADANRRIDEIAKSPSIAGVPGYTKTDYPKIIFNPFAAGGTLVDLSLDERVIELVEAYMNSTCVLAEANVKIDEPVGYEYFPIHADFAVGWRKSASSEFVLDAAELQKPIGVGGALYMHETSEGAFCYCVTTHKLLAPHGQSLKTYPESEIKSILSKRVRVDGMAGDLVLFDDRGFHGPDHPSSARRRVVLLDYYRVETFGYTQVSPMPVWTNDLGRLSSTQMRVLGAGADFMVPPAEYMGTRFKNSGAYRSVKFLIENAYLWQHMKQKLKAKLSGVVGR